MVGNKCIILQHLAMKQYYLYTAAHATALVFGKRVDSRAPLYAFAIRPPASAIVASSDGAMKAMVNAS